MSREDWQVELDALRARIDELSRELGRRVIADEPLSAGAIAVLVCRVGEMRVALPLDLVGEVVLVCAMAPLPEAPPWVAGLLDVRGDLHPVVDVAARISRQARTVELSDKIVICRDGADRAGLLVQDVLAVAWLQPEDRASDVEIPHAAYVRDVYRWTGGTLLLLGVRRLLASSEVPMAAT